MNISDNLYNIFKFCKPNDLHNLQFVNGAWQNVISKNEKLFEKNMISHATISNYGTVMSIPNNPYVYIYNFPFDYHYFEEFVFFKLNGWSYLNSIILMNGIINSINTHFVIDLPNNENFILNDMRSLNTIVKTKSKLLLEFNLDYNSTTANLESVFTYIGEYPLSRCEKTCFEINVSNNRGMQLKITIIL